MNREPTAPPKITFQSRTWSRHIRRTRNLLLGLCLAFLAGWLALPLVPLPPALFGSCTSEVPPSPWFHQATVEFLDKEGRPLREMTDLQSYSSKPVSYREIPQTLIGATVAAEDKRFWRHHGIDWRATARAALSLLRQGRIVSGGSTITQQLIKLAQPRPRTVRTKLLESAQALRLEQLWGKERILAEYLNRIDYGNLHAGCATAADFYFHKPLRDLSVAEAAFLAGLPQGPTRLNPHSHFERAHKRQRWILGQMVQNGCLSVEDAQRAAQEPLRLVPPARIFQAPHFIDLVLQNRLAPPLGLGGGNRHSIRTTLDLPLNQFAEQTIRDHLARLQPQTGRRGPGSEINGAAVVIENSTGNVLALVGSENYFAPAAGQVNGAWAARSAGSTFKPFTYLLAFEHGANPATVVADVETEFSTSSGVFRPVNYNHRCYGPMRYRLALANSLNISAVKVLASVGGPAVLQKRLQECGLTTLNQAPEFYGLGLTIGNAETRLLELANAYACLARLGTYQSYQLLAVSHPMPEARQVFDPAAAYLIADILSDNSARALAFGADSDLRFDFPVACKTGTSSDFRDNWAIGYTPEFTVGIWVGNFDGAPMQHISGVSGAAPILHELFAHLHEQHATTWYAPPPNVVERLVHPMTGKLLEWSDPLGAGNGFLPMERRRAILEKFISGKFPPAQDDQDFDSDGRVRLQPEYHDWLASGDNWLASRAILETSPLATGLCVVSPLPGTTYYLDPDLPASSCRLALKARGPACFWESDSLECRAEAEGTFAILVEGQHRLRLRDPASRSVVETWIIVKQL